MGYNLIAIIGLKISLGTRFPPQIHSIFGIERWIELLLQEHQTLEPFFKLQWWLKLGDDEIKDGDEDFCVESC